MEKNTKKSKSGYSKLLTLVVLVAACLLVIYLVGGQNRLKDVEVVCINGEISESQKDAVIRSSTLKMGAQIGSIADIENDVKNGVNNTGFARYESAERISKNTIRLTVSVRRPIAVVAAGGYYILIDDEGMVMDVLNQMPADSVVYVTGAEISNYFKGKTLVLRKEKQLEDIIRIASAIKNMGYQATYSELNVKDLKDIYLVTNTSQIVEIFDGQNIEQTLQMVDEIIKSGSVKGKITVSGDYAGYSPR